MDIKQFVPIDKDFSLHWTVSSRYLTRAPALGIFPFLFYCTYARCTYALLSMGIPDILHWCYWTVWVCFNLSEEPTRHLLFV